MKEIKLSQGLIAIVDDFDYEMLSKHNWYAKTKPSGNTHYAARKGYLNGKRVEILMHREILGLINDTNFFVDHIDHNGWRNTRENIRKCTKAENARNVQKNGNRTSSYKGVVMRIDKRFDKKKNEWVYYKPRWEARITLNKKLILIGRFNTELEAAVAYNEAAIKLHGTFASINVINHK